MGPHGTTPDSHYAVVYLATSPFTGDRWSGPADLLKITSLQLDPTGTTLPLTGTTIAPVASRLLFYGDSITEGTLTSGDEKSYAADTARVIGDEWGQVGYAGTAWDVAGAGGVPKFFDPKHPTAGLWRNYDANTSRLVGGQLNGGFIDGAPNDVFLNIGTNDANLGRSATNIRTRVNFWLVDLRSAVGVTPGVFVIVPFQWGDPHTTKYQPYTRNLLAGVRDYRAAHPSDTRVFVINLGKTGWKTVKANSVDGVHPNDAGALLIGQQLATAVTPNL